jgi:hypothetical protein
MADSNPTTTNPTSVGLSTSEGKLTLVAQVVGLLVTSFGGLLTKYAETHPSSPWAGPAVMAMGVLLMVVTQYGYVKGRAIVKNAMLANAIDWAAPQAAAMLEKLLAKQLHPGAAVAVSPPTPPPPSSPTSVTVAAPYTPPSP